MTAQVSDRIELDGRSFPLEVLPLEVLFRLSLQSPEFVPGNSANWRGYVASWKIENDQLWLTKLDGEYRLPEANPRAQTFDQDVGRIRSHQVLIDRLDALPEGPAGIYEASESFNGASIPEDNGFVARSPAERIPIEEMLSFATKPRFAHWYTGLLRIPQGEMIKYVHGGFFSLNEFDLIIEISSGRAGRRWLLNNKPAVDAWDARKAEQKRKDSSMLAFSSMNMNREKEEVYLSALVKPQNASRTRPKGRHGRLFWTANLLRESIDYLLIRKFSELAKGSEELSKTDRDFRLAYDTASDAVERAFMTISMTHSARRNEDENIANSDEYSEWITEDERLRKAYDVPNEESKMVSWAVENISSARKLIEAGEYELLGVAMAIVSQ
ncbi:hypothetical protein ASD99_11390 [Mesorhizobium sp. Root695]|uniref:hypothetical protein n=1 Tax=Mesorhizobium sp. Root695 TaxID=1736589 RepID=UPI00070CC44B|nr:hypothetical protein [Mesorhizobium sp. Root695]KRB15440.1 hypothetical protein ASD99_11390 [Mesorhizobium sp. Root695]